MGIRLPLQAVLSYSASSNTGPTSVAGGVGIPFTLPQDTDGALVKFSASILSGGASATFQTSDDGGTTWYDVARTSIVSDAAIPEWLYVPVVGLGVRTTPTIGSLVATGSVVTMIGGSIMAATGSSAASTLGVKSISGLPIMGTYNRIFLRYSGTISSTISEAVTVYTNSQARGN